MLEKGVKSSIPRPQTRDKALSSSRFVSCRPKFRHLTISKVASNNVRNKQLISAGGE